VSISRSLYRSTRHRDVTMLAVFIAHRLTVDHGQFRGGGPRGLAPIVHIHQYGSIRSCLVHVPSHSPSCLVQFCYWYTHLCIKYQLPKVFVNYFDLNRSICSYNRRGSNNLHIMSVHYNNYGKRGVKYKASSLWNRLLNSIKRRSSKMQFLRQIKLFLQSVHNNVQ